MNRRQFFKLFISTPFALLPKLQEEEFTSLEKDLIYFLRTGGHKIKRTPTV
jgi:hypothetical protein